MGYTFQRMFAGNYMSWNQEGIYIYKKGGEITDNDINLGKFMLFMETNPVVRHYPAGISFFKFYTNVDKNEYDYHAWTDENRLRMHVNMVEWAEWDKKITGAAPVYIGDSFRVSNKKIAMLNELKTLGWITVAYFNDYGKPVTPRLTMP